ncbi:MAG: DDE-type integrase/transposase/recombinase [Candidatus Nitrosoabyssus spongiisocia]|nr:MAG: DDE-type integrase/transposase/recombinase [Nitrosopumilaceae archaeon AB1(1)]
MTKQVAGNKNPKHFITDGLPTYMKSSKKVFGKKTLHTRHIHLKGDKQNNKMKRFNGSFRDREQTFRGLKKKDSSVIDGYHIYYNFTRKHLALNGLTPSESVGIIIDSKNKWKVLIQNASIK